MSFQDNIVVVTGGGRGLGRATALEFGATGAAVVVTARTATEIERTAGEIAASGGKALALPADVADPQQVKALFNVIDDRYGRVDILVNNAGVGLFAPIQAMPIEALDLMIAVNLKGTVLCTQEALFRMSRQRRGHIINVLSTAAKIGRARESGYTASKWAAAGFTESLKAEARSHGVRVTAFYPGGMNTDFWRSPENQAYHSGTAEFMDPREIARLIVAAASLPISITVDEIVVRRM